MSDVSYPGTQRPLPVLGLLHPRQWGACYISIHTVYITVGWLGGLKRRKKSGKKHYGTLVYSLMCIWTCCRAKNVRQTHFWVWSDYGVILSITKFTNKILHHQSLIHILWHSDMLHQYGVKTGFFENLFQKTKTRSDI